VRPRFLDGLLLSVVCDRVAEGSGEKAAIGSEAGDIVNRRVRDADEVELPVKLRREIERRIHALHPELETHTGKLLGPGPSVSFLRYRAGGRYRPHRDRAAEGGSDPAAARKLSVVLFLNDRQSARAFSGGELRFYGILGDRATADLGIAMAPEAGTLVAFDASLVHEVTEVIEGVRCTAVCWFDERSS
jgi:predicted 2-oxoglutarate/Fe(II)-dependent dioxygenase YbiX